MANVLITGGSRGIGAACVRRFAQAGHRVWFLYEKEHAAAQAIAAETGASLSSLSMAMSGDDYFSAMYANIDFLKEALQ